MCESSVAVIDLAVGFCAFNKIREEAFFLIT